MAEWIYDRPNHWYCSECKTMWTDTAKLVFRFCPSCGAKMENTTCINERNKNDVRSGKDS